MEANLIEDEHKSDNVFSGYFLLFFCAMGTLGFCTNLWGTRKFWKTFNLTMAPYLSLFLGTCFNVACLLISTASMIVLWIKPELDSALTCYIILFPSYLAYSIGSLTLCLISIFRQVLRI